MTRYSTVLMMHVYLYKYTYKRIIMTPLHHLYIALNLSTIDISVGNQFIFTVAPFSCHLIEKWVPPSPLPFEAWTAFVNLLLTCTLRKKIFGNQGAPTFQQNGLTTRVEHLLGIVLGWMQNKSQRLDKIAVKSRFWKPAWRTRFGFCIIWKSSLKATSRYPLQTLSGNHWSARCQQKTDKWLRAIKVFS